MPRTDARFWMWQLLGLSSYGILLLLIFRLWPIDAWLIAPYAGTLNHPFPLKDTWLLTTVAHEGLKHIVIAFVVGLLIVLGLGQPYPQLKAYRSTILFVIVAMAASSGLVGLLKAASHHSCPWHLTLYGGIGGVEYPLLGAIPLDAGVGKCFPGGHAAGGFALLALYFAARRNGWRYAWGYAWLGIGLGLLMGYAQMMRGAHFMSHNLWTLWWTWLAQLVVLAGWQWLEQPQRSVIQTAEVGQIKPVH